MPFLMEKTIIVFASRQYDEAVKPETPVISYDVDLTSVLGTNNDIRVGFTSAVGSSKANHTVHGFSFANYVESDYTVEHYKWNRNTNKYEIVSADTEVLTDRVGKEVTATSKTYENYRYNPSASLDGAEPKDTGIVTGDGNLKLRFYYDPIETTYTVKKFYQQADGTYILAPGETSTWTVGAIGTPVSATIKTFVILIKNRYTIEKT